MYISAYEYMSITFYYNIMYIRMFPMGSTIPWNILEAISIT